MDILLMSCLDTTESEIIKAKSFLSIVLMWKWKSFLNAPRLAYGDCSYYEYSSIGYSKGKATKHVLSLTTNQGRI